MDEFKSHRDRNTSCLKYEKARNYCLRYILGNCYVRIPFDLKWFYKDDVYTKKIAKAKIWHYHPKIRGDEAGIADRPRMVYTRAEGQDLFTSHAWRRVFEIQGPLLSGARRIMSWRQFILALGLHIAEEMAGDGFEAYWVGSLREIATKADLSTYWSRIAFDGDFLEVVPSYTSIKDPLRRLCHRLIAVSILGKGQAES
ncbi:hypothetical protein Tco_0034396 [Tanacetum coccineum]